MGKIKHILGLILLALLLCVGMGRMVATDCAVAADVCAFQPDFTEEGDAFRYADEFHHPVYAELGGLSNQVSLSLTLRVQRSHFALNYTSLKAIIHRLAMRLICLSKTRIGLCDFYPFYRCCPVNQYYIFTLKRILI